MEFDEIKSGISSERHIEIVKNLKHQVDDILDSTLFQARLCKTVGDEVGLERLKKEVTMLVKKIEVIDEELKKTEEINK